MKDQDEGVSYYYVAIMAGVLLGVALTVARLVLDMGLETGATLRAMYVLLRDMRRDEAEATLDHVAGKLETGLDDLLAGDAPARGRNAQKANER